MKQHRLRSWAPGEPLPGIDEFIEYTKAERVRRDLLWRDFADLVGVSTATIHRICAGHTFPQERTMAKVLERLAA